MKLPKAEQDLPEWQTATEALIMAAEGRGPLLHARVGMLRALNRTRTRVYYRSQGDALGEAQAQEGPMSTVWIYEKDDMLMVFETEPEARLWLALNDPTGVVTEQNVGLLRPVGKRGPAWRSEGDGTQGQSCVS